MPVEVSRREFFKAIGGVAAAMALPVGVITLAPDTAWSYMPIQFWDRNKLKYNLRSMEQQFRVEGAIDDTFEYRIEYLEIEGDREGWIVGRARIESD